MSTDNPGWETTPPDARALLAPFRAQIDALDTRIVALLGERFAVVRQVAALKAEHGIPPALADRLEEVARRARAQAEQIGLDPAMVDQIYRVILDTACRLEADFTKSDEAAGR
jgi:chorismate mutase